MIHVRKLIFSYGKGPRIFDDFSWDVNRGEAWSIIGPSGCGKTTLLYLLAGLFTPQGGTITIDGEPIIRPRPKTGLILQDHGLLPWGTVWENACLGLKIRGFYGPDGRHAPLNETLDAHNGEDRVSHWLKRLKIDSLRDKYPSQISGGERQRTAICRSLVMEPDFLLLDEPFSALDAPTREDLEQLCIGLNREGGLTMVIVTHNIEEAVLMGRHILVLGRDTTREPVICDNTGAHGRADDAAFQDQCHQLRGLLDNGNEIER